MKLSDEDKLRFLIREFQETSNEALADELWTDIEKLLFRARP
jgi:hypothetical protein